MKGYEQSAGIDCNQKFSPVARMASLQPIMEVHHMDVVTAFLNAAPEEVVSMCIAKDIKVPQGVNCLKLRKRPYMDYSRLQSCGMYTTFQGEM